MTPAGQADFRRARTDEQRAQRRTEILTTTHDLLTRTSARDLSLNEIARQVGLAKSNVLRYFESREAILLDLLDQEYDGWLTDLEAALAGSTVRVGRERVARAVAETIAERQVLCDLLASSASVLEHNVSGEVAAAYKLGLLDGMQRLVTLAAAYAPEIDGPRGLPFAAGVYAAICSIWPACRPSPGMLLAYEQHPELKAFQLDFPVAVRELVATVIAGLEQREPDLSP
ncbi:TetR/AcrR family transcriptional regulator [Luteipulveratus mongoliensis]|uniref:HTH tetR-type domain-containing protein n=1 Tax=Luteipulveratus mongoliensis TaxID=571913 RepID=A0A0K1JDN3_9MICO|nr:TetR family transcriptional regulator [Luteipulveratus mongoliensis]AKU14698.1 hypothetical protein VV02_00445 [Luteipulveratus mongoliensis]